MKSKSISIFGLIMKRLLVFIAIWMLGSPIAFSQSNGGIDNAFTIGNGFNSTVRSIAVQSDGKIVVVGDFTNFNSTTRNRIVRLNSDGTLDNSFNVGTGFNNVAYAVAIQNDGKILAAGSFTTYNGASRNRIVRLNADGSIDNTFSIGTGFNNTIVDVAVQPDGKIVVGGDFTYYNGVSRNRIVRLNSSGSIDNTFSIGTGLNNTVYSIVLQQDGKLLVGGDFTSYSGTARNRIIRLAANGSIDNTFSIGTGFNSTVCTISVQSNGGLIIGGDFTRYNRITRNRIVRLNSNGSIDNTFSVGTGCNDIVRRVLNQPDGKIFVAGYFTSYAGTVSKGLVRLSNNGSIDNSFVAGSGFNGSVRALALQDNGWLIAGGNYTSYNGSLSNYITRLDAFTHPLSVSILANPSSTICSGTSVTFTATPINGGNNPTFQWFLNGNAVGSNSAVYSNSNLTTNDQIWVVVTSSDICANPKSIKSSSVVMVVSESLSPKVSITSTVNGSICAGTSIAFNALSENQGSSPTYQWLLNGTPVGTNSSTYTSSTLNNNDRVKVILTSSVNCANPLTANSNEVTVNVTPNVSPTVSLTASSTSICNGSSATFTASAVNAGLTPTYNFLVNGKNIQNSASNTFTSTALKNNDVVSCMLTNALPGNQGVVDASFNVGTGFNGVVYSMATQSDGKIVAIGDFTSYYGVTKNRIVRLNTNGSIDNTLSIGSGFNRTLSAIALQSDGKMIVGGSFTSYNNTSNYRIVRLNATGAIDNSFNAGVGFNNDVFAIAIQADGKIIVGGNFTSYKYIARNRLVRLNSDGSIDYTFNIGSGFNSNINSIAIQSDGKILVTGDFTTYKGLTNNRIVRLNTDGSIDNTFITGTGFNNEVFTASPQIDGKIVVGGNFTSYNSIAKNRIIRLNADGSNDNTFNIGSGFNNTVRSIKFQTNDMLVVGGDFTTYNGTSRNRIVRLNYDASLDNTINIGTGFNGSVYELILQSDGMILSAGNFTTYNSSSKNRIVRIQNAVCFSTTATSNSIVVTVNPIVTPTITITSNQSGAVCQGVNTTFSASVTNQGTNPTYQWYLNNGIVGTNSSTYTSSSLSNNDIVHAVLTSNANCVSSANATSNKIAVNVLPIVVPTITIAAGTGSTVCNDTQVDFTATATNQGTNPVYQWYLNGNAVGTNSASYSNNNLANNDQIKAVLTSNAACASPTTVTSNNVNMVVNNCCGTGPGSQVKNIILSNVLTRSMSLSWTSGYCGNRVIFIKQDDTLSVPSPVNGTTYAANAVFGKGSQIGTSGWYCVYNGAGSSAQVTGLRPYKHYRIMALEYNGNNGTEVYNLSITNGNPKNISTLGIVPEDFAALKALYKSTNGGAWFNSTNWDTTKNNISAANPWFGVTVGPYNAKTGVDLEDRVYQIWLPGNNLTGNIPAQIGNLNQMKNLYLISNSLSGELPKELGNLTNLSLLYLNRNKLTGPIPTELGNLPNLTQLQLGLNQLTGEIPNQIYALTKLTQLVLQNNQLTGTIPASVGNLVNLLSLSLANNQLSGEIPKELGSIKNLNKIVLSGNKLTGGIPIEITTLQKLTYIGLINNQLTGSIPKELGGLTNLTYLGLHYNQLSGSIPAELGNLTKLTTLGLNNNQLSGQIPIELSNLTNLTRLSLSYNQLSGTIPAEFGVLAKLVFLDLSNNQLEGAIPTEICNLSSLNNLYLHKNKLSGTIPTQIGNLINLKYLYLYSNNITGTIPAEIGNLTNLIYLLLNNNALSGTIPSEFGRLINLKYLYIYSNSLSGVLPSELGGLGSLNYFLLNNNSFSGIVPDEISSLINLKKLNLSYNNFTELPDLTGISFDTTATSGLQTRNNKFTFYTLVQNTEVLNYPVKYYTQQAFALKTNTFSYNSGETIVMNVGEMAVPELGNEGNQYWLYKNGKLVYGPMSTEEFTIQNATSINSGIYKFKVTNISLPALSLWSDPFTINVKASIQKIDQDISDGQDNSIAQNIFAANQLLAYPNPTLGDFKLNLSNDYKGVVVISLRNNLGQEIESFKVDKSDTSLDLDMKINASSGIYIVEVVMGGEKKTIKVIKN